MGLEVSEAAEGDIDRLMEIQFSAFEGEPYFDALYPGGNTTESRAKAAARVLKDWSKNPYEHIIICTDTESKVIMGFGRWEIYQTERPESEWRKKDPVDWAGGRQKEVAENFLGAVHALRERLWEGKPHCLLTFLCTHPDYQRRGAGGGIVQWGIDQSERLGIPAYLEASIPGQPLYERLGFRPFDALVIRSEDWDGDHDRVYAAMVRDVSNKGGAEALQS